jgi:iron-sulfur cluster insertion protein
LELLFGLTALAVKTPPSGGFLFVAVALPSLAARARTFGRTYRSTHMSAVAENIVSEMPVPNMPEPILFTDSAAAKVADLIAEEGNPELKLRVFVQGGGCSGFSYGFTFDEITNEDDTTMTKNGVSLLIDAMSYQYLVGAEIDYKEDLQGAQFVIKNPNATSTCGCGSSFSA